MSPQHALEIDAMELLARSDLGVSDCAELRREVYRSDQAFDAFKKRLDATYPAGTRDSEAQWRRALGLWALGYDDEAAELLGKGHRPLGRYLLGRAALDRDDAAAARSLLEGIAGGDAPSEYRVAYAEALAQLGEREALAGLHTELERDEPSGADCVFVQGRLAELDGDYDRAVQCYERALSIQPDHRDARFRLAYRLDLMGRDQTAIQHYERLRQVFPVGIGTLLNLGVLYEDGEDYDKAISCYKLVLAHDPSHTVARMHLGDAEASMEMYYDEEKERKDDKRAQILKIPVTDFELSVRSRNCLARMNIRTLGDLVRKSEAELLSFKNFGETSLNEIKEILRTKGLRLGSHPDEGGRGGGGGRRHRELDRDSVRSRVVAELDLSVRSRRALDTLSITTVGQLAELTEEQLLACKNFGQTSLVEIKKKLVDLGLALRGG